MTATAHGMNGAPAAADWPPLRAGALAPVAEAWGLGAVLRVPWRSARPFAASGIVETGAGAVFVKRHDPRVRAPRDLAEEHAFIAHLRAHGAVVPLVLPAAGGATALALADGVYEVHAVADGEDLYRDTPSWTPFRDQDEAFAAGAALARLHDAALGFAAPTRQTRLIVCGDRISRAGAGALDALSGWVAEDASLAAALRGRDWRADFARIILPYCAALEDIRPAPLWGHGDWHASNLLWRNGAVSCALDFGLSNRLSAMHDLATAIERNCIAWLRLPDGDIGHADLARALLRGYDSVSPRATAERAALRLLLPVVHVEFALSELAYFHAITQSPGNAELAYGEFLLGHAAWFGGAQGRRFLDAL